jgi:hypothetical protein
MPIPHSVKQDDKIEKKYSHIGTMYQPTGASQQLANGRCAEEEIGGGLLAAS